MRGDKYVLACQSRTSEQIQQCKSSHLQVFGPVECGLGKCYSLTAPLSTECAIEPGSVGFLNPNYGEWILDPDTGQRICDNPLNRECRDLNLTLDNMPEITFSPQKSTNQEAELHFVKR